MSELRWNPLAGTFTIVADNRQNRPNLSTDYCPFCPGSGKVPDSYEVMMYPNDFPALSNNPDKPQSTIDSVYKAEENYGKCEVLLYSSDHYKSLSELSVDHIYKLVQLWRDRYVEIKKDVKVKYIFPFENKGEEVGVTMHHPHGQLYAYPFIPQKMQIELDNSKSYFKDHGRTLLSDMNAAEENKGTRIVAENKSFLSYVPYFSDYPYGAYIVTKNSRPSLSEMKGEELKDLASILKQVTAGFDLLFNKPFPYMMCIYQVPVNSVDYIDADQYYHFHIKFFTPLRSADKIKWMASSETGAGAAANTLKVEDTAQELARAIKKVVY